MNCSDCQENLSVFLDNELDESTSLAVMTHLSLCPECALLCEDFAEILDSCHFEEKKEVVPPNSRALWCRISNVIESENKPAPPAVEKPEGRWQFSFMQIGSAVLGVALLSSLLTVVAVKNYIQPSGADFTRRSADTQTTFEKILSKVGLADSVEEARENRFREQRAVIEYWNKRVQARRTMWDAKLRDAFDRNMREIDQSVTDYTLILQKDPQDELSGEMLDSALNDKMNLLREFSEL